MSMQSLLAWHLKNNGTIATARVSSARARGAARQYAYWGAVRYEVRLTVAGLPANIAEGRASSDRRSKRLAERDCAELCEREGREECQRLGTLLECECAELLRVMPDYADAIGRYDSRRARMPVPTVRDWLKRERERLAATLRLRAGSLGVPMALKAMA